MRYPPHLPADVRELLAELEAFGRENDEREADRSNKMLNLEPETAALVDILVRSAHRRRILEIGTSNGYSTIWLAAAARELGGNIISIDRDPAKHSAARANLQRAGLSQFVDLRTGEAHDVLARLDGPLDAVLFDADRTTAAEQLQLLLPKLAREVLVLADNVLSHPGEIAAYLAEIESRDDFQTATINVGKGLHIAYRSL
jgi:predicted O-methyltransferase YrrM